jgi:hypothetical protein
MTADRIHHLTARLVAARERAYDARRRGDSDGYRYAIAESRKYARILAEG